MALFIYALCALTAMVCSVLLLQAARRSKSRMLLWSGLCFAGLTITNVLVLVDYYGLPEKDLSSLRLIIALLAIALLLYGLVFEER